MMLMARWLVVLAVGWFVAVGPVFASTQPSSKSVCTESCAQHCPCCISKSTPADSSAPLAPTPSTRPAVAQDFQLIAACQALWLKELEAQVTVPPHLSVPHFSASLAVFVRHCTFLI